MLKQPLHSYEIHQSSDPIGYSSDPPASMIIQNLSLSVNPEIESKNKLQSSTSSSNQPPTQSKLEDLIKVCDAMNQKLILKSQKQQNLEYLVEQKSQLLKQLQQLDKSTRVRGSNMSQKYLENLHYLNQNNKIISKLEKQINDARSQYDNQLNSQQAQINRLIKIVSKLKIQNKKKKRLSQEPLSQQSKNEISLKLLQQKQLLALKQQRQQQLNNIYLQNQIYFNQQDMTIAKNIQNLKQQYRKTQQQQIRVQEQFNANKNQIISSFNNKKLSSSKNLSSNVETSLKQKQTKLIQLNQQLKQYTEEYIINDNQVQQLRLSFWEQNAKLSHIKENNVKEELLKANSQSHSNINQLNEIKDKYLSQQIQLKDRIVQNNKIKQQKIIKLESQPKINFVQTNLPVDFKEQLKQLTIKYMDQEQKLKDMDEFDKESLSLVEQNNQLQISVKNVNFDDIEVKKLEIEKYKDQIHTLQKEILKFYHNDQVLKTTRQNLDVQEYKLSIKVITFSILLLLILLYV